MEQLKNIKYYLLILVITNIACKLGHSNVSQEDAVEQLESTANITPDSFDITVDSLMQEYKVPGVSISFIKDGILHSTRNYGFIQKGAAPKVNEETMFSVGSISKVINALLTLKLVDEKKLKLDEDINQYLTEWKVEENGFTKNTPVTLRKILSHTAGFSVHGFADYLPEESLPTTLQILNGEKPAKNEKVEVIFPVGSKSKYSGGGITVIQKIIEEVTGLSYHEAARQLLFDPLKLKRTSYENPLPASFQNVAKAHDNNGNPIALPRGYQAMPEMAASGLWTTPSDLTKLIATIYTSQEDSPTNFLSAQLAKEMVTEQYPSEWGLGPQILHLEGYKLVEHGGANDSYKALFCVFWEEGFGYVVFTNGSNGMDLIQGLIPVFDRFIKKPFSKTKR